MKRHLPWITVVAVMLMVPAMVFGAANKFAVSKAFADGDNIIVVPLEVKNQVELAAMDIPLSFPEGVTLKEVTFEGTRVEYFDFKMARIDNENHNVVIGLMPMFSHDAKPDLAAGEGAVANLVFEVSDPNMTEITLEPVELTNPNHRLSFVYRDGNKTIQTIEPEFGTTSISLNNLTGDNLPGTFALNQNYPNPFNPTTSISFDLPVSSDVKLDVFNVLGQKVETLVDKNLSAGSHVIEFDASSLSSGVYFYRISADNFEATKKMMLLK